MSSQKKPIILTIDDEPQVLNAVERDLRKKYGKKYRIMKSNSGTEAIKLVKQLKKRNETISLFLVDQRMPQMEGTEFLIEATKVFSSTKKVLLTAYADTEAAIKSINDINLDYYLVKPWNPPEENLYPVLDDILDDWEANVILRYEGIKILGTLWSAKSHEIKDFLARNRVPYQWFDIDCDPESQEYLESLNLSTEKAIKQLPIVFLTDGSTLLSPTQDDLANKIGMKTQASSDFYDLIVIGGGPAGLAAGVYGPAEGLKTVVIEKIATGGQAGTSSRIENYLGFPNGISGLDLARRAETQVKRLGGEILLPQEVTKIDIEDNYKIVSLKDGKILRSHALIIATGIETKLINIPGIDPLIGAGVYYGAAITEANSYRDKEIFILGGGNSAGQSAMFFSAYVKKVSIIIRRSSLVESMSQYLIERIENSENINLITDTVIEEIKGDSTLKTLFLKNLNSKKVQEVSASALFIFIGATPRTELLEDLVERDEQGYILTGRDLLIKGRKPKNWNRKRDPLIFETNIPGIFAAGDVRHDSSKRVAAAVGEGSVTVQLIHQYLKEV
ncbi:MAG: Thioredoxin reductase [Candidatus Heimdallarchaeota archaeon LC_3]|nr:MAG: Thioredoxin reductase [Candidatus Heimdallarchaeota archaeon LC_3]